jgi:hypothetical protein
MSQDHKSATNTDKVTFVTLPKYCPSNIVRIISTENKIAVLGGVGTFEIKNNTNEAKAIKRITISGDI